jgi:hypothetical protein
MLYNHHIKLPASGTFPSKRLIEHRPSPASNNLQDHRFVTGSAGTHCVTGGGPGDIRQVRRLLAGEVHA